MRSELDRGNTHASHSTVS